MTDSKVTIRGSRSSERRIGILGINLDPVSRETLETLVAQTPGAHVVDNVDRHVTPREVMRLLEEFQHRVCVINFDEGEESARTSQRIHDGCDSSISIFAASSDPHPDQIIAAMRAGCSEYLLKPFQAKQVTDALSHIEARQHGRMPGQKGHVVTLMGAKGGAGTTSLALHLALNLAQRQHQKCLLVDQHPALGDLALCLGMGRHQYSFYELVHNMDRLDADLLQGFLLQHPSGLHVLDSPEAIHAFSNTPSDAIEHTLAFLAENYQFVLVDCPPGLSEDTCAVIRQSDRLAIIITPELPAIHNAIRSIQYLTSLHYPDDSIDIVLNRYSRKNPLSEREIESSLHRQIAVKIPNDYDLVVNAINAGTPIDLDRKSELAAAFDTWADRLMANEPGVEKADKESRGLFSLFGSKT
ncbi:MAG: AAA family ATPase [Candidatus Korobacteraceae bacterium]|jgi:pilus assembly protein CpaE